ncbi:sensor histidine kinase [Dactylosporangium siamense]|uniref:histidine kinase n=1 Tax=Dactylosporangium siamense TaxID=685454 RepID=A0A919PTM4_9ACTN|nr:histidine kinase [Dactylosporangium siamense]GIG50341.1 two-component sensor histidine kinase [Dactylosporangium siamense]
MKTAFRRPDVQDAFLAVLLLVVAVMGYDPSNWILGGVCAAAVAVRRRWPIPAFAVALLAAAVSPADLALPLVLYTVAAHRRRGVSLPLLGAGLLVATARSVYGTGGGWQYTGPFGSGGQTLEPQEGTAGIPVLGALLIVAWAIGWGVRSRRAYLDELARSAALAVAAERARIAREVHDVVAHGLAVIVMQAQGGAAAFAKRPADTLAALDTIMATGRASLADMRQVLSSPDQVADAAPVPGLADLPRLVDRVRRAGTPVELRVDGAARAVPTAVDVSAYRIIQEALTNTMKHAGPGARARVSVTYGATELVLSSVDDGRSATAGTGNGQRGMRERATLLGGSVTAGPGPDGGYVVRARIPLEPDGPA